MDLYVTGGKLDSGNAIYYETEKSPGMASCRAWGAARKQADTKSSFIRMISTYNLDDVLNKP
jgi:hypothetical protein